MACGSSKDNGYNKEFQDLNGWKSYILKDLLNRLSNQIDNNEVRVYTVASTWFDKNAKIITHKGSGPNLEGGLATLCTCKHSMRQGQNINDWKGKWILGVTSRDKTHGFNGEHYLLYLMKVERTFESHKILYQYLHQNNPTALQIKNAANNPLGDIFEPSTSCVDPLDPRQYKFPHKDHSHGHEAGEEWEWDISNKTPTKRTAIPLLLGDINNTFVWQKPVIKFTQHRGVGNKKMLMKELLFNGFIADCT